MQNNSIINLLTNDRDKTQTAINNIVAAIEQGIITSSTKKRLDELESKLNDIQMKLSIAETRKTEEIKKENLVYRIKSCLQKSPKQMLESLINKIILYDDKIEIHYNIEHGSPEQNRDFLFYTEITDIKLFAVQYSKPHQKELIIEFYC